MALVCMSSRIFLAAVRCRVSYSSTQRSDEADSSRWCSTGEKDTQLMLSAPHEKEWIGSGRSGAVQRDDGTRPRRTSALRGDDPCSSQREDAGTCWWA